MLNYSYLPSPCPPSPPVAVASLNHPAPAQPRDDLHAGALGHVDHGRHVAAPQRHAAEGAPLPDLALLRGFCGIPERRGEKVGKTQGKLGKNDGAHGFCKWKIDEITDRNLLS